MTDLPGTRTPDGTEPQRLHSLRGRAEAALSRGSVSLQGLDAQAFENVSVLLEELRIYQAELELQNQELVQAYQRADRSEQRLRGLFEGSPLPVIVLDRLGVIHEANAAARALFGLSTARVRLHAVYRLLTHRDDPALAGVMAAAASSIGTGDAVAASVVFRTRHAEAHNFRVHARAIPGHDGEPYWLELLLIDESSGLDLRLEKLAQHVPGAFHQIRLAPGGEASFLYAGGSFRKVFGMAPEDFDPARLRQLVPPGQPSVLLPEGDRHGLPSEGWIHPFHWTDLDGRLRWLETDSSPERMDDGSVVWHGYTRDITERRRLEQELAAHRDRLEDLVRERTAELAAAVQAAQTANRAKSRFLGSVSHELRTPLTAILGFTELALRGPMGDQQRERLQSSVRAARLLDGLVDQLIELTRAESGRVELVRGPFNATRLLRALALAYESRAADKHLKLQCEIDPALAQVELIGDERKLTQVLANLLDNAIKFTASGTVALRALVVPADPALGLAVRFEVTDTGLGIAAEDQARIFQLFEQGDGSSARPHGGTGLGLYMGRKWVQAMGGQLELRSAPGQGSCFFFTLVLDGAEAGVTWTSAGSAALAASLPASETVSTAVEAARLGTSGAAGPTQASALATFRADELRDALSRLLASLEEGDPIAGELLTQIRVRWPAEVHAPRQALGDAVRAYEFDRAAGMVKQVLASLGGEGHQDDGPMSP